MAKSKEKPPHTLGLLPAHWRFIDARGKNRSDVVRTILDNYEKIVTESLISLGQKIGKEAVSTIVDHLRANETFFTRGDALNEQIVRALANADTGGGSTAEKFSRAWEVCGKIAESEKVALTDAAMARDR